MNKTPSLEDRIRTALGNPNIGSEVLVEIIQEVEQAAATADQAITTERAKLLDVTACRDPDEARERISVLETSGDRMLATAPRLKRMLTAALAAEARDRWWSSYKKVKAQLDEAVELFKQVPQHAQAIVEAFSLAIELDKTISHLNVTAPDGIDRRLRSVELTARGMTALSRDNPSLAANTVLPDWNHSTRTVWPARPSTSLAVMAAGTAPYHPAGRWADPDEQARRRAVIASDQARSAAFHEQAAIDEENRINASERERLAAHKR
jgi:hypothetical protein